MTTENAVPAAAPAKNSKVKRGAKPARAGAGPLGAAPAGYFMYGQEVQVTVGDYVFAGTIGQSANEKEDATRTQINDAATGGLTTDIFNNRLKSGSVTGVVLAAGFTKPRKGDPIEINGVDVVCTGSDVKYSELAAQVTIDWDLYDSMAGAYV